MVCACLSGALAEVVQCSGSESGEVALEHVVLET